MLAVLLAYGDQTICKRSLESVMQVRGIEHIDIILNPTEGQSDEFEQFVHAQRGSGLIRNVMRFDENISNNAYRAYVSEMRDDLLQRERVVISDCDVLVPPSVLEEHNAVLDNHRDVFACGTLADLEHWNDDIINKRVEIEHREKLVDRGDHYLRATGFWFVLFKTAELLEVVDRMERNGVSFVDGNIKSLAFGLLQKRWVAGKHSRARELTREQTQYYESRVSVVDTLSQFSAEPSTSRYTIWNHNKTSGYTLISPSGEARYAAPVLAEVHRRFRGALADDPAVNRLREMPEPPVNGFLVRGLPARTLPSGIYFVHGVRARTGWPEYDAGKMVIYLGPGFEPVPDCARLDEINIATHIQSMWSEEAEAYVQTLAAFLAPDGHISAVVFDWKRIEAMESASELLVSAKESKFMRGYLAHTEDAAEARQLLSDATPIQWTVAQIEALAALAGLKPTFAQEVAPIIRVKLARYAGPAAESADEGARASDQTPALPSSSISSGTAVL